MDYTGVSYKEINKISLVSKEKTFRNECRGERYVVRVAETGTLVPIVTLVTRYDEEGERKCIVSSNWKIGSFVCLSDWSLYDDKSRCTQTSRKTNVV